MINAALPRPALSRVAVIAAMAIAAWWAAATVPAALARSAADASPLAARPLAACPVAACPVAARPAAARLASEQARQQARAVLRLLRQDSAAGAKCTAATCRTGLPAALDLRATQQAQARDYVPVALPAVPATAQVREFEADLVADLNHQGGVPLAGNTYEVAGGPHLGGNPVNQTIFHWFDIRGYQDFGAVTDYEASVHGASSVGWSAGVPAYSSLSSAVIAAILGDRGDDW